MTLAGIAAIATVTAGRTFGQASKTFRVERVGDQRHRLFVHDVERCLEFRPELKVATGFSGGAKKEPPDGNGSCAEPLLTRGTPAEPRVDAAEKGVGIIDTLGEPTIEPAPEANCSMRKELSTVPEVLQFIPEERGSDAEREGEGLTMQGRRGEPEAM